ncbi:phospholipase A1-like [Sabethes cyaneus]|uniref:phospholipase A1-like n=1 Tax=Sabethes cyaneus TaxID=53552 RepID=UPI00237E2B25|nr:phospholipase A1-like [Sabethes cyaneus]
MWQFLVIQLIFLLTLQAHSTTPQDEKLVHAFLRGMSNMLGVGDQLSPLQPIDKEVIFNCTSNRSDDFFQPVLLDDPDLLQKLDLQKPIAFIIHGWNSSSSEPHFQDMAHNYSRFVNCNICLVDWTNLSRYEYDVVILQSLQMVVAYFTRFLRFLNTNGISYANVTLVGHSLGAQISGLVGKSLNGAIGQIFALDPAALLFTTPKDVGVNNRLVPTDAQYVQAIFTSKGELSMEIGAGHQNFWMNDDGKHPQPGCKSLAKNKGLLERFFERLVCSHMMAAVYFTAALDPAVNYTMKRCFAYGMYQIGLCFGKKDVVGIHAKRFLGDFYGSVDLVFPYGS